MIVAGGRPPHLLIYDGRRSSRTAKLAPSFPLPAPTMRDFLQQRLIRVLDAQCGTYVDNGSTRACDWSLPETATPTKKADRSSVEAHAAQTASDVPRREALTPKKPRSVGRRRPPGRSRGFDHAVLAFVAAMGAVAARTVVRRFWTHRGRTATYGSRVIHALHRKGLIENVAVAPMLGRASRLILRLTPNGYAAIGQSMRQAYVRAWASTESRDLAASWADAFSEWQADGWKLVQGPAAFEAVRRCAAARYRTRSLSDTDLVFRDRVRKAPPVPMPVPVFTHTADANVWLVVRVAPDRNLRRWLDKFLPLRLFAPLPVLIVSSSPMDGDRIARDLKAWQRLRRIELAVRYAPSFMAQPNPFDAPATGQDRYLAARGIGVAALELPDI